MSEQEPWQACPNGELNQLADSLRREDRRRALRRIGGASVAVVVAGVGVYAVSTMSSDTASLVCAEVGPLLPAYINGGLTSKAKQQVTEHLKKCAHCREKHEAML